MRRFSELSWDRISAGGRIEGEVTSGEGVVAFRGDSAVGTGKRVGAEDGPRDGPETVLGLNTARGNPNTFAYSAQLASQPGLSTNVNLINTADEARNLMLTAVRGRRHQHRVLPFAIVLGAGGQLSGTAADVLFGGSAAVLVCRPVTMGSALWGR